MNPWKIVALFAAGLQLLACEQKPDPPVQIDPMAAKAAYSGETLQRVRLTAKRAAEIGIATAPVREEQVSGTLRKVIPASAVIHDEQGNAWLYKSPDSLVYVRERISVTSIEGGLAVLSEGPPVGTAIVIAGATELSGDGMSESREGIAASKTTVGGKEQKYTGVATMKEDGTIKVVYSTAGTTGLGASIVIEYKPQDEDYQKILDSVGGLKAGESKPVAPLPEE